MGFRRGSRSSRGKKQVVDSKFDDTVDRGQPAISDPADAQYNFDCDVEMNDARTRKQEKIRDDNEQRAKKLRESRKQSRRQQANDKKRQRRTESFKKKNPQKRAIDPSKAIRGQSFRLSGFNAAGDALYSPLNGLKEETMRKMAYRDIIDLGATRRTSISTIVAISKRINELCESAEHRHGQESTSRPASSAGGHPSSTHERPDTDQIASEMTSETSRQVDSE